MPGEPATRADLDALEQRFDTRLDTLEQRFDEKLNALEQRFDGKLNALEQRFDEKLNALEQRFDEKLNALKQRFDEKLDAVEQRILDRVGELIRDSETRLLQAFYGFAEATNKRLNQIDTNMAIFINRLGTLESRMLEVEKRLNIPPAP